MENKLSLGIDELDLDVRSFNVLKRAGVNTIADIEAQAEQLAETIPARQWKHITDVLNAYKGIPMPGSLVEKNILGDELTFDEIAEMVGEIIILDRSTESRNWYKAVKVEDVFVSNDDHRHLRYFDGAKQRGIIDEMYFSKSQRNPQRAWRVKPQDKPAELPTVQPERAAEIADAFNYAVLSAELGDYLKRKEEQLKNEYMNFTANCGRIFAEAQERLANNKNGLFEKWIESMGFKRDTVYRMIQVHKFVSSQIATISEQEIFAKLPKMLQYDIAAPSAPPQLVEQVMNGDITTHKEYIELKKQLEAQMQRYSKALDENHSLHDENQSLRRDRVNAMNRADNAEHELSDAKAEIKKLSKECERNTELEQRIKSLESQPRDVAVQSDPEAERKFSETLRKLNLDFENFRDEADRDLADMRNQRNAALDRAEAAEAKLNAPKAESSIKPFLIKMTMDDFSALTKAVENDPYLKKIIQKAQVIRI